jgi:hypothetical protein
MSPFSAPFFWGTQKRRLLLPKQEAALWEGTQWCKGGTERAEDEKLPGAGISPKPCPRKCAGEKRHVRDSVKLVRAGQNYSRSCGRRARRTSYPGLTLELETEERELSNPLGISTLRHRKVDAIQLSPRSSINPGVFL